MSVVKKFVTAPRESGACRIFLGRDVSPVRRHVNKNTTYQNIDFSYKTPDHCRRIVIDRKTNTVSSNIDVYDALNKYIDDSDTAVVHDGDYVEVSVQVSGVLVNGKIEYSFGMPPKEINWPKYPTTYWIDTLLNGVWVYQKGQKISIDDQSDKEKCIITIGEWRHGEEIVPRISCHRGLLRAILNEIEFCNEPIPFYFSKDRSSMFPALGFSEYLSAIFNVVSHKDHRSRDCHLSESLHDEAALLIDHTNPPCDNSQKYISNTKNRYRERILSTLGGLSMLRNLSDIVINYLIT